MDLISNSNESSYDESRGRAHLLFARRVGDRRPQPFARRVSEIDAAGSGSSACAGRIGYRGESRTSQRENA